MLAAMAPEGPRTLRMDPAHRHLETWTIEDELDWAISVGPNTHMFLQGMFARKVRRDMAYRSVAALKSVAREVGPERLEAACTRALQIGATSPQREIHPAHEHGSHGVAGASP